MSKMKIYEPAMCCPTGLCGVGIDSELLRISTVIDSLKKIGVEVERFNLSNAPQAFISNKEVNNIIQSEGTKALPITVIDERVVMKGRYPTNEEISSLLGVRFVVNDRKSPKSGGCCDGGSGCC